MQLPTQYKYNKVYPPSVKIKDQFGESFEQLVIPAEITIKDILEISDSKLSVVFMLRMTWRDPHLVFNYLKVDFSTLIGRNPSRYSPLIG